MAACGPGTKPGGAGVRMSGPGADACERATAFASQATAAAAGGYLWSALEHLDAASEQCPTPANADAVTAMRARLWLDIARPSSSADEQKLAIELYRLGTNERLGGALDDALKSLTRSFELAPHPLTLVQIAMVHNAAGRPVEGRIATARALAVAETWSGSKAVPVLAAGHRDDVVAVAPQPGGDLLATLATGQTSFGSVALWSMATGRQVGAIDAHCAELVFSPDGQHIALATRERTIDIWDVVAQMTTASYATVGVAKSLHYSANGDFLVAIEGDSITVRDAANGTQLRALARAASVAAISPDGSLLAVSGTEASLDVIEVASGRVVYTLRHASEPTWEVMEYAPDPEVSAAAFSPDGSLIATAASTDGIRVWEVATGREQTPPASTAWSTAVEFSADGSLIASLEWEDDGVCDEHGNCGAKSFVVISNARTGQTTGTAWDAVSATSFGFRRDGNPGLVTGTRDGGVVVYDVPGGNLARTLSVPRAVGLDVLAVHPRAGIVYNRGADRDEASLVRLAPTGESTILVNPDDVLETWVAEISLSANGDLAVSRKFGHPALWKLGETRATSFGDDASWARVALSRDGALLATSDATEPLVRIWDVRSRELVAQTHAAPRRLAWNRDATALAMDAMMWKPSPGSVSTIAGDPSVVVFLDDVRAIAATDSELWMVNTETGEVAWRTAVDPDARIAVSPDATRVAITGRSAGPVMIREASSGDEVSRMTTTGVPFWLTDVSLAIAGDAIELWDVAGTAPNASLHMPIGEVDTWLIITRTGRVDAGTEGGVAPDHMYWKIGTTQLPSWVGWDHRRSAGALAAALAGLPASR